MQYYFSVAVFLLSTFQFSLEGVSSAVIAARVGREEVVEAQE